MQASTSTLIKGINRHKVSIWVWCSMDLLHSPLASKKHQRAPVSCVAEQCQEERESHGRKFLDFLPTKRPRGVQFFSGIDKLVVVGGFIEVN